VSRPRVAGSRHAVHQVTSRALLLRSVPVGESDLMITLFTQGAGTTSAGARSARKSTRRFGALEPLHELAVTLEVRDGSDIAKLVDARIERPRLGITRSLDRLDAAGHLLRWVRRACPPHVPEPSIFEAVSHALDALDGGDRTPARAILGACGLAICEGLGWGLDLERCVGCGKPCPDAAPSAIDPRRGGLVCRACGGARRVLPSDVRSALRDARTGDHAALDERSATIAIELVDAVLDAHAGPAPEARK
jgi:DNA repair protein RecO (recombination protein O)